MIRNGDSVFFDWDTDRVLRGGVEAKITGQQKKLLRLLVEGKAAVKSRDYLLKGVWGKRAALVDELYLVQLVYRLRKALSPVSLDGHIVTVPRQGYRFIPVAYTTTVSPPAMETPEDAVPEPVFQPESALEQARGLANVLARLGMPISTAPVFSALSDHDDTMHIDEAQGVVSFNGIIAKLTRFELRLLIVLKDHGEGVMSRHQIITSVWGPEAMVDENCLTQLVSRLRRALHPLGLDTCVSAVPKIGYRFRPQTGTAARTF
ncbi:winged helix-turn-helix domain-containing protein [Cupriavidus agavae]|uniref:DNA-binding winged helix-turn-helix (WHTH) protein n=1 Tax=Cupriavidus agavae TaxID=1001822 RepID=A0A4Q7RRF7_9BURK|nr:winged helix-turn-helix domain-containing protein [Cupriavidus agavae]RZT36306.1 DNA-binding winged helix-turn-helix (wHTH) protein [Cupriavidus agavae]